MMKNHNSIILYINKNSSLCCGCSTCEAICSANAIHMELSSEGFYYPSVDEDRCVNCGTCLKVCCFGRQANKECLYGNTNGTVSEKKE